MKNWLKQRIHSTDWNTEMFTAEDIVNFHNDFTIQDTTKLLNSNINKARENLQASQRNLGLAFVGLIISVFLAIAIHYSICLIPLVVMFITYNTVTRNRKELNSIKREFLDFKTKSRW